MSEIPSIGAGGIFGRGTRRVEPVKPIVKTGLGGKSPEGDQGGRQRQNKEPGKGRIVDFKV
ncbi:MAG: hypothetical protein V4437_02830 [Patescibacteria group bacterium]